MRVLGRIGMLTHLDDDRMTAALYGLKEGNFRIRLSLMLNKRAELSPSASGGLWRFSCGSLKVLPPGGLRKLLDR
jgi:hypothetical protein